MRTVMFLAVLMLITPVMASEPISKLTYYESAEVARMYGKPLATFIGQPAKQIANHVVCEVESLDGYPAKCVVYSEWRHGVHYWIRTEEPKLASSSQWSLKPNYPAPISAVPVYRLPVSNCPNGKCPNAR